MALTDTAIRNAKALSKAYKLYDEGGLFLQVTPSGGKWWRLKYRFEGKEKLLSLGTYPDVPLAGHWENPKTKEKWIDGARDKRDNARKLLASDPPIDPSETRKKTKAESTANKTNTFEVWADKWLHHWQSGKSERHALYVKRRLEADVYPTLGNRPIKDINAYDVKQRLKLSTYQRPILSTFSLF